MSDLIDRQAAISAICNACGKIDCDKMDKCEKLQLPPANYSEFPNNSDTISRQAAIDATWEEPSYTDPLNVLTEVRDRIEALPSAQPERKKGRWRRRLVDSGFNADWHCSECGWKTSLEEHGYNFCPNCGADMRQREDTDE